MINNEDRLEELIHQVLVEVKQSAPRTSSIQADARMLVENKNLGIFSSIDQAVLAARKAFGELNSLTLDKRKVIIKAIREQGRLYARELAKEALEETQFGDFENKVAKNVLVCEKTPGPEIIQPSAFSGDHGLTVLERAPYGVIGSITPSTNPTATIINNAISIISAGNTVVFNVHPRARLVSIKTVQLLNKAIIAVGGPNNLITGVQEPTIESAQQLMGHDNVDLLLITGGPSVVKVAMQMGKRAICAGPGNPPVVVDETADLGKAAEDLVKGASFDNNLPCTCEKEIFAVESIFEKLKNAMRKSGAVEISQENVPYLEKLIFKDRGNNSKHATINPDLYGQPAADILKRIGVSTDSDIRLIILEVDADHPLVWTEQMMPVLPLVRVRNFQEGVDLAVKAEQGFHHSAGIHSLDIRNLSSMAKAMNTSLFIKNGPMYAGLGYQSEGYTSFSIGTYTREGLTTARTFTWERRCTLVDYFRIV